MSNKEPKVVGIGGVFFKCKDPNSTKDWYKNHLGLKTDQYGTLFEFRNALNPDEINYLQWSPFKDDTTYFEPSTQPFMINYRVQNMEELVEKLKSEGVTICDEIATYDYGKFVHIMDADGNKLELWEPVDEVFTESSEGNTTK
ncbi:VOC family protein [Marinoscillum pacificum]|uniref:VOC family protein n=1 Tax=Marinoscillum pacificum TaxID=392723 RepID=UPI0021574247|nr:VOC family protein [Marinoscillum pacificum]